MANIIIMNINTELLTTQANLALQVNRSHLERMEDFLRDHYAKTGTNGDGNSTQETPMVDVLLAKKATVSKSCSLIFLSVRDEKAFIEHMIDNYEFVLHGLNKLYVMMSERSIMKGNFTPIKEIDVLSGQTNDTISHNLLKVLQTLRCGESVATKADTPSTIAEDKIGLSSVQRSVVVKVKVEVFPSRLQHQVVSNLTTLLDAKSIPETELDVSPTDETHILSILKLDYALKKGQKEKGGTYLVGIAPRERKVPIIQPSTSTSDDICRAFYKLKETFERYRHISKHMTLRNNIFRPSSNPLGSKRNINCTKATIAVDCGASPGGWTKYLQTICDEVYSIDPGDMDESVASLPNVHHMKMTAAEAIPDLRGVLDRQDGAIALWASDMCVHDVPKQVDVFLCARKEGVFEPDAAFVLTIKCNIGHGKQRFDKFAEEEANRLKAAGAYGVHIMHLFSNRIGERTIVGFIK